MSLFKQLPNILGTISQVAQLRTALRAPKLAPIAALPAMASRQFTVPRLGAPPAFGGFTTGRGFPAPSSGATQRFLAAGFTMRKRRRTNPTNVKALRRALRRVEGFIKIEKRVDKIVGRMAPRRLARQARTSGFVRSRKR